jgi:hypothetical protein
MSISRLHGFNPSPEPRARDVGGDPPAPTPEAIADALNGMDGIRATFDDVAGSITIQSAGGESTTIPGTFGIADALTIAGGMRQPSALQLRAQRTVRKAVEDAYRGTARISKFTATG